MKNLILLNRSGMSPEVTCRKGRHAIESIVSRFSLASLICLCMLTLGAGNAWGTATLTGNVVYSCSPTSIANTTTHQYWSSKAVARNNASDLTASANWEMNFGSSAGLGSNKNQRAKMILSNGSMTGGSAIATAIGKTTSSTYVAAFVCNTALSNVGKFAFSHNGYNNDAPDNMWLCYSTDNWSTATAIALTVGNSGNVTFDATIPSAKYAFVIYKSTYTRVANPTFTFYEGTTGGGCSDPATALSVSAASTTIYAGVKSQLSTSGGNGSTVTYTVISANSAYATIDGDNKFSATRPGTYRVQASQDASGGTCGGTSTVDITVRYQIKWSVNGDDTYDTGSPTTYIEEHNGKIGTFPTSPAKSACDGSKEFVGWATTTIATSTNTEPTFVTPQTQITGNTTLYAVFATRTANSYSPGDINDLINGKNVIIYNANQNRAMASSAQASGKLNALAVTFSSTNISSPDAALIWTVYNSGTKYIFKSGNNYLRVTSSSSNTNLTCDGTSDTWTITEVSTGVYSLYSTTGSSTYPLEAYYSSPNFFFTSYKGSGANYNMKFYVPTYTEYVTSCSSTPTLNVDPSSLDFGNVASGTYKEMTFSLSGTYLTANANIAVSGTNSSYFSVTPSSVSKGSGTISATNITVRYTPGAVADGHTATVTVSSTGADDQTVTLSGNCKASYTVSKSAMTNGDVSFDKSSNVMAGETVTITISPSSGYQLSSITANSGAVSLSGTGNTRTFTMPASNVTVSATFTVRTDYVLVESALADYSGEYLIVYHSAFDDFKALSGRSGNKDANGHGDVTTVTSYYNSTYKSIESNATTDAMKMVIEPAGTPGRYTIYWENDATYLGMTASNTGTGEKLRFITSANLTSSNSYEWGISLISETPKHRLSLWNNEATPVQFDLEYNTSTGDFRIYKYSASDPELYKKVETCTKLDAPTGLTETSVTQTTCTLGWNAVEHASGYEVSLDGGSNWTSTGTNRTYNVLAGAGWTQGTSHTWKVRATGDGSTYCDKGTVASHTVTMKAAVTVTYRSNGSTGGQLPVASGVVNLTEGDSHTILGNTGSGGSPTPLTKTGYVFDGWHSSSTYSSTPAYTIGGSITVNSSIIIYANWKPKKDTFVDAVHNTATQYGEGYNYTIPSCSDQTRNTSGTCEVTHYKFIGWALPGADLTNPANIIHAGDTQTASGTDANPKTYYAVWAEEL